MTNPTADLKQIEALAAAHPDAERGVACPGTQVESTTYSIRGKSFVFLRLAGERFEARLKLEASRPEATALQARQPAAYSIGTHGWAKLTWTTASPPPMDLVKRWIDESYQLMVENAPPKPVEKPAAKAKTAKAKTSEAKPAAKAPAAKSTAAKSTVAKKSESGARRST